MIWIAYALLVAAFTALKSTAGKKCMRNLDEYVVAWFMQIIPGILISLAFLFVNIPVLGGIFWPVLIADCLLSAIAAVWSTKALISELSLTIPLVAFTPLFLILTGWLMLGEVPSAAGIIGVVLIVVGAYVLNYRERKNGWLAPFRSLISHESPKLMLGSAFIWSITANLDKIAVQNSSPIFFAMAESFLIGIFIFPFAWKKMQKQRKEVGKEIYGLMAMGIFASLALVFQMMAISQTLVVYVNSIKRLGIPLSILLGGAVFKEKDVRLKFAGGCIMVLGVLCITML